MVQLIQTGGPTASTNAYVSLLKVTTPPHLNTFQVQLKENNVNAIKYKILGSQDDSTWVEIKAETVLAKNAAASEPVAAPYRYVDIQIASNVTDTHGNATTILVGKP